MGRSFRDWYADLAGHTTGPIPPGEASALGGAGRGPQGPEWLDSLERHLLKAALAPEQAASVEVFGWFELPWPAQWLVIRVHADRVPTVDAFQARPESPAHPGRATSAGAAGARWVPVAYLCSWDVRAVRRSQDGRVVFETRASTPAGYARRVLEAHRRGALRDLLEAADVVSFEPNT
jgi:hypothetical protein